MLDVDGDGDPPPPLEPPPSPPHSETETTEDELGTSGTSSSSSSPSSRSPTSRHVIPIRSLSSGGFETANGSPSRSTARSISTSGLRSESPTPPSSPSQLSLSSSTGAGADDDNSKPNARACAEQAEPFASSASSSSSSSSSSSPSSPSSTRILGDTSLSLKLSDIQTAEDSAGSTSAPAIDLPKWLREAESERMIADRFLLGDELGRGAFGRVYKGVDVITGKLVALKEIQKTLIAGDQLNDILREAALLRELNHPNIVKLIKAYQTERHLYFVLEYVEGGSLHDSKKMGVPEILLVRYVSQILQGLEYLHSKNVVHRDIKGANILLTKEGKAKLADFGSCSYARMDRKLTMIGTPFWMAPEVIAEENNLGFASDIWSLGCTVIEVLTGAPPYWKLGAEKALFRMCIDPHPPLPDNISEPALDFLKQCFVRDASERPAASVLLNHPWIVLNMELSSSVTDGMETLRELTRVRRPDLQSLWDNPPDVQLRQITAPKRPPIVADPIATPQISNMVSPASPSPFGTPAAGQLGAGPLSPMPLSLTSASVNVKDTPDPRAKEGKEGKEGKNQVRFSKKLQFFRERERASSMATEIKRAPGGRRSKKHADAAQIEMAVSSWAGDSPKQPKAARVRHSRQRSTSLVPQPGSEPVHSPGGWGSGGTPNNMHSGSGNIGLAPGSVGVGTSKGTGEKKRPCMQELEGLIDGLGKFVLVTNTREFLLKGTLGWNSPHAERTIFLFNDLLLITKKKSGNKQRFEFKQQVYLDEFVEFKTDEFLPLIIKMIDKNGRVPVEHLITFKTQTKLNTWVLQLRTTHASVSELHATSDPSSIFDDHQTPASSDAEQTTETDFSSPSSSSLSLSSTTPPASSLSASASSSAAASSSTSSSSSSSISAVGISVTNTASASNDERPQSNSSGPIGTSPLSISSSTVPTPVITILSATPPVPAAVECAKRQSTRSSRSPVRHQSPRKQRGHISSSNDASLESDDDTPKPRRELVPEAPNGRRRASSNADGDSLQVAVTDAARQYEQLLRQYDSELQANILSKQSQVKELEKKVETEQAFKAGLDQTVEHLQQWVSTLAEEVTTLQGKLSFFREMASSNLVQREEALDEIRNFLKCSEPLLKPTIDNIEWILPGVLCQARSDDGTWADAVVTGSELENKAVFYTVVYLGSSKFDRLKSTALRPNTRLDPKQKIQKARSSFFALPMWK